MNQKSDRRLIIDILSDGNFTGDVFQDGTFDGIQRPVIVFFEIYKATLDYLPEGSFKEILDQNKENKVRIYDVLYQTTINCEDCRNYWLIRETEEKSKSQLLAAVLSYQTFI